MVVEKDQTSRDSLSAMKPVAADEVLARVRRFWQVFSAKARSEFEEFYLPGATIFAANAPRIERPGFSSGMGTAL
jgi:hypothetical protein